LEYLLGLAAPDWEGAISAAVLRAHLHILEWMLSKREDRRGPLKIGFNNALEEATAEGHFEILKLLHEHDELQTLREMLLQMVIWLSFSH
ncbi:hypothetical protein PHMEG_00030912, partial [Phytophthora megakarya]